MHSTFFLEEALFIYQELCASPPALRVVLMQQQRSQASKLLIFPSALKC